MAEKRLNISQYKITSAEALQEIEDEYRDKESDYEMLPFAKNTDYVEIATHIIADKIGSWATPLIFTRTIHKSIHGIQNVCIKAEEYIKDIYGQDVDVLSVSALMNKGEIVLNILVRPYCEKFSFVGFFKFIGDSIYQEEAVAEYSSGNLIIPDEIKNFRYTDEEIEEHDKAFNAQNEALENCSKEEPFLNMLEQYVPHKMPTPADRLDLIYDLKTNDMKIKTIMPYEEFNAIFQEILTYVSGVEYYHYIVVMQGEETERSFMDFLETHIRTTYIDKHKMAVEDLETMKKKLYRALFQMYVIQDLIDDPNVTDIKITAPDSIRARVKGKAYISNITFVDDKDYCRFADGIVKKNRIQMTVPVQTFTDKRDENYILRLSITAPYVTSSDVPYLHIRKISRNKPLGDELIRLGMLEPKVRDYLLDCARTSRGVVFAGPPGSGKTVALNWFIEEGYEQSAEILIIQENDELFTERKGIMFEHVVNYSKNGEQTVDLEQLGQIALVAGANVFIIGEAKGAEICSAITLSNSGCRTAITIHSPSSTETIDKMADLAMRGYAKDIDQAKRMLKSFQTIVYLQDFQVKEISEITGYNEQTHEMEYRYIYRKER